MSRVAWTVRQLGRDRERPRIQKCARNRVGAVRSRLGAFAALAALLLAGPISAGAADSGAVIPWTTYEAEGQVTNGQLLGPDFTGHTPQREASGRRCVRLSEPGQFVEIRVSGLANAATQGLSHGLVVRHSIPDTPDGRGQDATISLYLNGRFRQKLPLTSRLSYLYGEYPFKNDPSAGKPRNFWDEARVQLAGLKDGDAIRLQRDSDDSAAEYLIDFLELEPVPAPLPAPAGSISVIETGAVAGDEADDRPAFLAAIEKGRREGKPVWIPPGTFVLKGPLDLDGITLRGAGMWHSTLVGVDDYVPAHRVALYGCGSNIHLSDFAIIGKLNYRNDSEPNDGIGESFGAGSTIRNIWVEHTKAGAWLANADGLVIEGCRFRNTIADGINLCVGMRNTVVRNCTARGTGDDCFAMWPATYTPSRFTHGNNRYIACTAQLPFLAQGFAVYGGEANAVLDCEAIDVPYGAGLYASTTFPTEFGFRGTTLFRGAVVTRAGGTDGAVGLVANGAELPGVRFEDIRIVQAVTDAIRFTSIKDGRFIGAEFDGIAIESPSGLPVSASPGAKGSARLSRVQVTTTRPDGLADDRPSSAGPSDWRTAAPEFTLTLGEGNQGLEAGK